VTGTGAKKPPAAPRKRKKRAGPVSLHPLSFDDAMRALLAVPSPKAPVNEHNSNRDRKKEQGDLDKKSKPKE
jgi:hypothetical protein